jgi:hypothetical protein
MLEHDFMGKNIKYDDGSQRVKMPSTDETV